MTDWISSHRPWAVALAVLAVAAVLVAVATRDSADAGAHSPSDDATTTTTTAPERPEPTSPTGETPPTSAPTDPNAQLATGTPSVEVDLPLDVTVTPGAVDASGISTVQVHIVAHQGSQIYGAEARICPSEVTVVQDADFRPTQTGQCALNPLRDGADDHLEVAGTPPYQTLDLSFRTGAGSDTYTTQAGDQVTVRCDADHPCSLVLKLQVPNVFGFRPYPIPFS